MIANRELATGDDRRTEPRLRYCWDTHIYVHTHPRGTAARMIDLNRHGAAFLLNSGDPVNPGDPIELRLTYPRVEDGQFQIMHAQHTGTVIRSQAYNDNLNRIVVQFAEPMDTAPVAENQYPTRGEQQIRYQ